MKQVALSFNGFCDVESAELLSHIGQTAEVPPSVASMFFLLCDEAALPGGLHNK